jgi:hypothetical protein
VFVVLQAKFSQTRQMMQMSRRFIVDKIRGTRGMLVATANEQVMLAFQVCTCAFIAPSSFFQQRCVYVSIAVFTETHERTMQDLFTLSTSTYSAVRARAQKTLGLLIQTHPYWCRLLMPRILHILSNHELSLVPSSDVKENVITHEQFKVISFCARAHTSIQGTLYMLLSGGEPPLVARQDWAAMRVLWPALARARQGDKTSVIKLMSLLQDSTVTNMQSFTIKLIVSALR